MRSILYQLLNPITIVWLLLLVAMLLLLVNRKRAARIVCIVDVVWLFLISISPLPIFLVHAKEQMFSHPDLSQIRTDSIHVLILGAGSSTAPELSALSNLSPGMLGRLVEGVRIYNQVPVARLICSGNGRVGDPSQAEMVAQAAVDLGIDPSDTCRMQATSTTREEARWYKARFGSHVPLVLVTSALHMERALHLFKEEGLSPIPAPANYHVKSDPSKALYHFRPSYNKIQLMDEWLHEQAGWVGAVITNH